MKIRRQSIAVLSLLLVVSVTLIAGCATTGMQRAEKTTVSMQNVEGDIKATTAQVDATNASLNEVIQAKDTPDVKRAFEVYSDNVAKMEKTGKTFAKHSDEMNARGNDYFQEWQKSGNVYTNPEIQKLSAERRNELSRTFSQVAESSTGVKGSLNAYISEIKQIQTYLSNDLSGKGIEAISPIAQKAVNDGNNVKSAVQPMLSATAKARAEIGEAGAAAGGGPRSSQ